MRLRSSRALPAYTPCPAARFFPPAWRPKYRANRGPNRRTARPARQGRSRTAAGAKCYPFRHAAGQFGRIFVQIARSPPDFRRQRDDFAFIGFVHKNSDILHRGQVFRQAVFLKQKTRFAESIAYRARFRRFQARNQTQNRRLATAARPEC